MRHLSKIFLSLLILFPLTLTGQENNKIRTRELFAVRDIPQTISVSYDIGEIAVGNPSVASVVVDRPKRRILISPLQVGETALLVFDTEGRQRDNIQIVVTSQDLDQFVQDLKFLFRDIEGLQFRKVGSKVVIEGEVYLKADLDRISQVLRGNTFVVNLVSLSQDTRRILSRRIRDEINIPGVEVTTVRDRIVIKGEVVNEAQKERAEKIAQIYVDKESLVNVIAVNPKKSAARAGKLIQVTAHFVELNKSFLRNFNFSWTPIANTQFQVTTTGSTTDINLLAIVTEFLPKLNTAKALGVARVFENPTVSVKSGNQASVRSGANIFIPIPGREGETQFGEPQNVGVTLNVTPTVDEREFIDMQVSVEVSNLGSAATEGTILVNQSSVNTTQYVRSGETVAIGGVLRSAFTDVKDAPPGQPFAFQPLGAQGVNVTSSFGNIFQIFKSRSISQDRNMFIVFLTPEVLVSARETGREIRDAMNMHRVSPTGTEAIEEFD